MEPQTPVEANIAVVRRALDAINRGDMADLATTVTPDFVRHDLAQVFPTGGVDTLIGFISMVRGAVPDFEMTIVDIFATDEQGSVLIRFTGTHEGELLGMPGTGGQIDFNGISLYRFRDGLIRENRQLLDLAGLTRQLSAPAAQADQVAA